MFKCNRCGYSTELKANFKAHLNRKKICESLIADVNITDQYEAIFNAKDNKFKCEFCDKSYSHQQSQSRHQKSCEKRPVQPMVINNYNIINNIDSSNNVYNININYFGNESIEHIINHPDFVKNIRMLIKNGDEDSTLIAMVSMIKEEPSNQNITKDKDGVMTSFNVKNKPITVSRVEYVKNVMKKLKALFIKFLEQNDVAFVKRSYVAYMLIQNRLGITKRPKDEEEDDPDIEWIDDAM